MKIIISVIIGSLVYASVVFAGGNPPEAVKSAFEQKFTGASGIKWTKENKKEWEAEFTLNGIKESANFLNDGTWRETESEISYDQFPAAVSSTIASKYPGWKVMHSYKIITSDGVTKYEAELKSKKKKKEMIIGEDGNITK
jgi:hypothetical protein